jgi:hypothetical protein
MTDMAADPDKPENAMWRSQLYYRTYRLIANNRDIKETVDKKRACVQLVNDIGKQGIEEFQGGYRIALHAYLYQNREQT